MRIPAKTFLVGEYSALARGPALLVTTSPAFSLNENVSAYQISPNSPAGVWLKTQQPKPLYWHDPYNEIGGLGASSAQFVAFFKAYKAKFKLEEILQAYFACANTQKGINPSGYDIIAQTLNNCVVIDASKPTVLAWPFKDIDFLLAHTNNKLATHLHLKILVLPKQIAKIQELSLQAINAFRDKNSQQFISYINKFYKALSHDQLVCENTAKLIKSIASVEYILGAKGCGALGADMILFLFETKNKNKVVELAKSKNLLPLATKENIYQGEFLGDF